MRKGKVLLFPMFVATALCIVVIIGGLIFMLRPPPEAEDKDERTDVFEKADIHDLTDAGLSPDLDGNYRTNEAKAFG